MGKTKMQKKLIALAVAAAVAAPMAAMADVKISGYMHASWDFLDADETNADDSDDATGVMGRAARASHIRFSGNENLGNGLKAIWQIESQIDNHNFAARNTWVGLAGSWGSFKMGRLDTPYKQSTGSLDVMGNTVGDYNTIISTLSDNDTNFDLRPSDTVSYWTPNFNGFSGGIMRSSMDQEETNGLSLDDAELWSMMAKYSNGPFFASLAWEDHSDMGNATATQESDAWKLGLGYKFGNSRVGFIYEDIDHDGNNSADDRDAFYINFAHKFGANRVTVAYGDMDDSDANGVNDGADYWALGICHSFSKRTEVYAIYADVDNDRNAMVGTWSTEGAPEAGGDASAFSLGLIHKF